MDIDPSAIRSRVVERFRQLENTSLRLAAVGAWAETLVLQDQGEENYQLFAAIMDMLSEQNAREIAEFKEQVETYELDIAEYKAQIEEYKREVASFQKALAETPAIQNALHKPKPGARTPRGKGLPLERDLQGEEYTTAGFARVDAPDEEENA